MATEMMRRQFPLKKACIESFGKKEYLLISKESVSKIDCMGSVLNIREYCQTKFKKNYIRSYVNSLNTKIVCESAAQVNIKIECKHQNIKFCKDAKRICKKLKSIYAYSLKLNYFSVSDEKLTCQYQTTLKIDDLSLY